MVPAIKKLSNLILCFYIFDYTLLNRSKYHVARQVELGNSPGQISCKYILILKSKSEFSN